MVPKTDQKSNVRIKALEFLLEQQKSHVKEWIAIATRHRDLDTHQTTIDLIHIKELSVTLADITKERGNKHDEDVLRQIAFLAESALNRNPVVHHA